MEYVEEFTTTMAGLLVLGDWLEAHGVTQVAMEVPGRKADVKDAQWLRQLLEAGLHKASLCHRHRSARCVSSRGIARASSVIVSGRPTGCTR